MNVPVVYPNERNGMVTTVREHLNVPGDDLLDTNLQVLIRGFQKANGLTPHGAICPATLAKLDIWYF